MNTTLHPFKRRDIPDVLSRALKRAHGGIPETLTGRAFSKVKVWFIVRYRFVQSDRLNLQHIQARKTPSYFLPSPYAERVHLKHHKIVIAQHDLTNK